MEADAATKVSAPLDIIVQTSSDSLQRAQTTDGRTSEILQ